MPPTIAATSTLAMVRMAEARGVETADLLRQEGIGLDLLEDPDARIPGPVVLELWNALRERTGDPALQLAAPTILPFGAYRVIDYLVDASATLGEGIQRFARFFGLIADAAVMSIDSDSGHRCLCLALANGGPVPPVYVDYVFAAVVGRIRMQPRPDLDVSRVELRGAAPADPTPYTGFFRSPVRFGAAADRLCFTRAEWDSPIENADAALARVLEEHARILSERLPDVARGFVSDVRSAIVAALPDGAPIEVVAGSLNVSVRTLQRKLAEAGTSFSMVADSVGGELAKEYLADPTVSIAEVALLLGFSEQSSFQRAFRRWTGESPGRWRLLRRRRGAPPPGRSVNARTRQPRRGGA